MTKLSRRNFLRAVALGAGALGRVQATVEAPEGFTPDEALDILRQGNRDFLAGRVNPEAASAALRDRQRPTTFCDPRRLL